MKKANIRRMPVVEAPIMPHRRPGRPRKENKLVRVVFFQEAEVCNDLWERARECGQDLSEFLRDRTKRMRNVKVG